MSHKEHQHSTFIPHRMQPFGSAGRLFDVWNMKKEIRHHDLKLGLAVHSSSRIAREQLTTPSMASIFHQATYDERSNR